MAVRLCHRFLLVIARPLGRSNPQKPLDCFASARNDVRILNLCTILTVLLCLCSPALAAWKPVGSGEMHVLFWHAYDSQLRSKSGVFNAAKPYVLENTYRMDFSARDLIDRTFEEMKRHGTFSADEQRAWDDQLVKLWPDIREGQRIKALVIPNRRVVFYIDGKKTGSVNDTKFSQLFPAIWLGENTSEPSLRMKLLKLNYRRSRLPLRR